MIKAKNDLSTQWLPGYRAAQHLGIGSHLLSRITGSIYISKSPKEADTDRASKVNVGLNLKFNKKNEEICGFTQKRKDNMW